MGVFKNPPKRKEAHDSREIIKSSIKLNELFLIALMMIASFSKRYVPLKAVVIDSFIAWSL